MTIKLVILIVLIGLIGLSSHVGAGNGTPHEDGVQPS